MKKSAYHTKINLNNDFEYEITFWTQDRNQFEHIQSEVQKCLNDVYDETRVCFPVQEIKKIGRLKSSKVEYICSNCDRSITPDKRGFFVHCPFCGYTIDYSNHQFLREGLNVYK